MRLNLGCGADKRSDWLNVDRHPTFSPDAVVDLERLPWPWADNSADEILLCHVLEHLGAAPETYIGIMKELWRVCRPDGLVTIVVPHPRHDHFLSDPTHVRPVTGEGLLLFSRKTNEFWVREGFSNTPLALQYGIDFELVSTDSVLEEPWASERQAGTLDDQALDQAALRHNNVIRQQTFVLRAQK